MHAIEHGYRGRLPPALTGTLGILLAAFALQGCSAEPLGETARSGSSDPGSETGHGVAASPDGAANSADTSGPAQAANAEAAGKISLSESETAALVEEYLFKPISGREEAAKIRQKVRSLDVETARRFHRMALDRGNATERERELATAVLERAESKGISFLDTNMDDMRHVFARVDRIPLDKIPLDLEAGRTFQGQPEVPEKFGEKVASTRQAACAIWEFACPSVSSWNGAVGPTTCGSTCTTGASSDNFGNSPCEVGGCDTRIKFNRASATRIDGTTSAADCIIDWYDALSKYSSGGVTYVSYGVAGPIACALYGTAKHNHFRVR